MGTLTCALVFYRQVQKHAVDSGIVDEMAKTAMRVLGFIAQIAQESRDWVLQHTPKIR